MPHPGRQPVGPVEEDLGQARQEDEAHHGDLVLHFPPLPANQAANTKCAYTQIHSHEIWPYGWKLDGLAPLVADPP